MGNAVAKETCRDGRSRLASSDDSLNGDYLQSSTDLMRVSPTESPPGSQSAPVFAPQIPTKQRAEDVPSNSSLLKGIPVLITWSYGGKEVLVEGSWDNWTTGRALQMSGKDHAILLVLPSGVYHYKFLVDGEWRHIPDAPSFSDTTGQTVNLLDVTDYVPENPENTKEFDAPPSPETSYGRSLLADEDFAKDPPALPPQLHLTVLGSEASVESSAKPQHVVLNHLFIEKGWIAESLVALGMTHRFQSKYITVVLYKPMIRQ